MNKLINYTNNDYNNNNNQKKKKKKMMMVMMKKKKYGVQEYKTMHDLQRKKKNTGGIGNWRKRVEHPDHSID